MYPSRFVHMSPKQRDLVGFDEVSVPVRPASTSVTRFSLVIFFLLLLSDFPDQPPAPAGPQGPDAALSERAGGGRQGGGRCGWEVGAVTCSTLGQREDRTSWFMQDLNPAVPNAD